jgi:NTP pyrophosphatase (non-canonical NTP hydrolase)
MKGRKLTLRKLSGVSKLTAIKFIKDLTDLGLKESKDVIDSLDMASMVNYKEKIDILIFSKLSDIEIINKFEDAGYEAIFKDRKTKLKRLLYSDKKTLIFDMLLDMSNWESFVEKHDLDSMVYNDCKEIAINKIIDKYEEYIEEDFFHKIFTDITRINKLEEKDIAYKFIKFNEEFGEFSAEFLKLKGYTYKSYDKDELVGEMADTLQVLLSIYSQIGEVTDISLNDILEKIVIKNIKWENKIKDYTKIN